MAMRKVGHRRDIYPVFRELFAKKQATTGAESMNDFGGGIRAERPLFEGADWEFGTIQRVHDAIEKIAIGELGLDTYPNQIEIIGTEQMLDAYSSIGMPLFYKHWSFGKHFARNEAMYRAGMQGLAYEIVINSNPCISYIMEENTATMQTLVIAHAAFGHNHFFKNNYVFKQWTDADGILDYLEFARGYIAHCEERYGEAAGGALAGCRSRADEPWRPPLPAPPRRRSALRRAASQGAASARRAGVQRPLAHRANQGCGERRQVDRRSPSRAAAAPAGKCALFPREDRATPAALAARNSAHRPASSRSTSIRSSRPS